MEAPRISLCLPDRPHVIEHYLSTNDALSPSDSLARDGYLTQLNECVENLESDIVKLQIGDDAKNAEKERLLGKYELCINTRSPIRKIPPEILGVIFAFAVNTSPFNRFINVANLRGVCSSWRQAALSTPGLWDALTIYLDKWCPTEIHGHDGQMLLSRFEEELRPWLAIVNRTVTLRSPLGMFGVNALASSGLTFSARKLTVAGSWKAKLRALGSVLPNLEALEVGNPLSLKSVPPFRHPSLTTLQLSHLVGQGIYLRQLIQELPSLRELRLSSKDYMSTEDVDTTSMVYTHHSLEILFLDGEDFLPCLRHLSFPSLRFLEVYGHSFAGSDTDMLRSGTLTRIFSNSSATKSTFISIRGEFDQPFLTQLAQSLPPHCNLLVDIDEDDENGLGAVVPIVSDNIEVIFCGRGAVDLLWLSSAEPARKHLSRPLKVYIPTGFGRWERGYSRQDELRSRGFELEPVSNEASGLMLRSLAPSFSKDSVGWWECELVQNLLE
ncbi:hypothetical protein BKA70DRAFT_1267311 [Coprinopsis sp. MPI-PUGE-AT-0042]|nr:hypothetical protein BKA70DRAFT_1267311 [Coprinopsis sp. MPI-PUGE-AT-0042]